MHWLENKRHKQIKSSIEQNQILNLGLKSLLNSNHQELMSKLSKLDGSLMALASKVSGFDEVAIAIKKDHNVAEQSILLLRSLNKREPMVLAVIPCLGKIEYRSISERSYCVLKSKRGFLSHTLGDEGILNMPEPNLIHSDLSSLLDLGLIHYSEESDGINCYRISRSGVNYLSQLGSL